MNRVAALYDIHCNLPALRAVLEDVRRARVDLILIGGDVFPGPMPLETIQCLQNLDTPAHFIRGNGDREILSLLRGSQASATLPESAQQSLRWVKEQLPLSCVSRLASWPETISLSIEGVGEVFFCHATPTSDTEIFTRLTPGNQLVPLFSRLKARVVVCGHTHMQFDRTIGETRVINAGSVGMPFGKPGAYWLLLGPDIQLRQTSYDLVEAAEQIRETSYPQASDFAANNVLNPPSEEQMLRIFSSSEPQ